MKDPIVKMAEGYKILSCRSTKTEVQPKGKWTARWLPLAAPPPTPSICMASTASRPTINGSLSIKIEMATSPRSALLTSTAPLRSPREHHIQDTAAAPLCTLKTLIQTGRGLSALHTKAVELLDGKGKPRRQPTDLIARLKTMLPPRDTAKA